MFFEYCKNVKIIFISTNFIFQKCHFQSYQVVRVIRTVRRGEEVSIDYGFDFYANPLDVRQKRANSQYHFACKCVACVNNWPIYNDLVRCSDNIKCCTVGPNAIFFYIFGCMQLQLAFLWSLSFNLQSLFLYE